MGIEDFNIKKEKTPRETVLEILALKSATLPEDIKLLLLPHLENAFRQPGKRAKEVKKKLLEQNEGIDEEELEKEAIKTLDAEFSNLRKDFLENIALPMLREKFISKVVSEMKRRSNEAAKIFFRAVDAKKIEDKTLTEQARREKLSQATKSELDLLMKASDEEETVVEAANKLIEEWIINLFIEFMDAADKKFADKNIEK